MDEKKYTEKQKMAAVHEMVMSASTREEVAEKYGVSTTTMSAWKKRFTPTMVTIEDTAEMTEKEIDKAYDRNALLAKIFAIQRVLTLIPGEKDISKLTQLLRELKSADALIDPTQKDRPWSIQVNQAIQQVTNNIIQKTNGKPKSPDRD